MTDTIARNFARFNADNPRVYEWFDYFTRQLIASGHKNGSAKMVCERIRWETHVATVGTPVKINNNYTAMYARMWMKYNPSHAGFFRLRARSEDTADSVRLGVEVME